MRNLTAPVPKKKSPLKVKKFMYYVVEEAIGKPKEFEKKVNDILNKADNERVVVSKVGDQIIHGETRTKEILLAEFEFLEDKAGIAVPNSNLPFALK